MGTFIAEFNATLLQYHGNSSSTYFCGDNSIDLLEMPRIQMYENYFDNILEMSVADIVQVFSGLYYSRIHSNYNIAN